MAVVFKISDVQGEIKPLRSDELKTNVKECSKRSPGMLVFSHVTETLYK